MILGFISYYILLWLNGTEILSIQPFLGIDSRLPWDLSWFISYILTKVYGRLYVDMRIYLVYVMEFIDQPA